MSHVMAGVLLSRDPALLENMLRDIRPPFQRQVLSAVLRLRDDTRMDIIELDRLIRADQNIASIILKMAICELLKFPSIPTKVTINEYLEIAKEYSTPKSSIFINGILDNLVKEFTQDGKLKKSGRGLL